MNENELPGWFWDLLESGRSLRKLCRQLEALPREQLLKYRDHYDNAKEDINPYFNEELASEFPDWSEDDADDFAAWAVSQGREFYARVLASPEDLEEILDIYDSYETGEGASELRWDEVVDCQEYRGYQRADYIATPIFEMRFGESLEDALEKWREETA